MVNVYHPPPEVVASWPEPNYRNPETQGPGLIIVCILLSTLGIGIVSIRLYARAFVTRALGIDDILIVLATIFAIVLTVLNIIGNVKAYNGAHIWDIPPSGSIPHRINIFISEIAMALALSFTKVSVLLFYRRLSVSFSKKFLIAVWVGIIYNILYAIAMVLTIFLFCQPLEAWWLGFKFEKNSRKNYHCGKERTMEPLTAVLSSVSDIYTALLPMILIFRLDLPSSQKRALYILFGLAFLVVITGIIRIAYMYIMLTVTYDFTWTMFKFWILTQVEMWMAIFVASAPALKPMVKKLATKVQRSMSTVSQRMHGLSGGGDRHAKENKELMAMETNETLCTKEADIENGIVMSDGVTTNPSKDQYCVKVRSVGGLQDMFNDDEAKSQGRGKWWEGRRKSRVVSSEL